MGFKLFDRTSRTVTLTAQGRSFLPYARGVLEQVELAQVIAGKLAAGTAGQLALGYVSSIALSDLFSQSINIDKARTRGVEVATRFALTSTLSLTANYTYTDATNRSPGNANFGRQLVRRPQHSVTALINCWYSCKGSP